MSYENDDEDELNQRINRRLVRLKRLFIHLVITLVLALGLTFARNQLGAPDLVDGIIPLVVLLFVGHALWVMSREARHFIIQQETAAYQAGLPEKPKRSGYIGIGDDGELVEFPEEEAPDTRKTGEHQRLLAG